MLRRLTFVAFLPIVTVAACGSDDSESSTGTGTSTSTSTSTSTTTTTTGSGGSGTSGSGGAAGAAGAGAAGAAGDTCDAVGETTISAEITGLPDVVAADVSVTDGALEHTFTGSGSWETEAGPYSLSASRVTDDDPIVRSVFDPEPVEGSLCAEAGETHTLTVDYTAIPSSNKLWTTNANGDHSLVAFASAVLETTGDPAGSVTLDSPAGDDIAFDQDGNLWSMGPTTADPHLVRFSAASLADSGDIERDRGIVVLEIPCSKELRSMAFDMSGNLWLSTCGDRVVRLTPEDLATTGEVTPALVISGVTGNQNLAFDADGNLWVVSDGAIVRFDAERLTSSTSDPADRTLNVTEPGGSIGLGASDLAFDTEGNLWATDFGANAVFQIAASELSGTGTATIEAAVRITIGVTALIDRPAFDESGGLWIGLGGGGVGRLAPEQLSVSTGPGDPTDPEVVITSADLGSVGRIAFFPAAADLPLYHSLP